MSYKELEFNESNDILMYYGDFGGKQQWCSWATSIGIEHWKHHKKNM